MNDPVAVVVANRADQRRQVHHIAADQRDLAAVNADGIQQPLIERYVENHRPLAAL
jgi:hypothetical protein